MLKSVLTRSISIFVLVLSTTIVCDEFSEGPYGTGYFDIAGPFSVADLNISIQGDVNLDEIINIQDVILLVGEILGNTNLDNEQLEQADVNDDGIVDVLDIVNVVSQILYPQLSTWDFEDNWTGNDSYIFIQYDPTVSISTAMWLSNTKDDFLDNSPMNVHYFFISNRTQYEADIQTIKDGFDEILSGMSTELQNHWDTHLHFINNKTTDLDNWLTEALSGKYALSIDCFQRLREVGYLGNPASFTGTYLSYIAHEALYFDYENTILDDTGETYDEIIIFDEGIYTGGWASSISQMIETPTEFSSLAYNKMEVELLRGCPDGNGGYSDAGCDEYDRIAHMYFCEGQCYETQYFFDIDEQGCIDDGNSWNADDGICYQIVYLDNIEQSECTQENYTWNENRECYEMARWITPFDRQPHSLTDITPFLAFFRSNDGEQKLIKFQESGWPNSLLTLKIRLYHGENNNGVQRKAIPMWNGTVQFNPNYGDNRPPQVFEIPGNATKVEFVSYITGHGWGSAGCFNCCEFCNSKHIFSINGGVYEFDQSFPDASSSNHCMQPETIQSTGVIPNQGGTWGYGRAGWCPGRDVEPYIMDITNFVQIGEDNVIDYDACRVSGNSCVTPPTCQGDGYCPEIAMSSYIIIHY